MAGQKATRRVQWVADSGAFLRSIAIAALVIPALAPAQQAQAPVATPSPYNSPAPPATVSGQNPLPLGSNAVNQPLLPGTERVDYAIQPYVKGQPLVLMSISGGGSRSAYYAARVMEELSKVPMPLVQNQALPDGRPMYSLLDTVRVMSTVSAGGLASTWYVTNFDRRKQPNFFEEMKAAVSVNLQWRTYGHMALFPPLAVQLLASSVTRTDLLADEIDSLLGDRKMTFNDLRAMETRPVDPAPTLLINGTVYNSGQRLVMSNLPALRFPSIMGKLDSNVTMPSVDQQTMQNLWQPLTFADFGSDIGCYPVSKALAASAAYPILLAPVPLRVYPNNVPHELLGRIDRKLLESKIAYVADGGLYENEGVDPLLSVVKSLDPNQPVLLLIVDGSERMETLRLNEGKIFGPVTAVSRMYDIGTLKPLAYYSRLMSDFHNPKKTEFVFIRMEGYDEKTQETLRNIPTQFKLSNKHREALDTVAEQNVSRMYQPMMEAYARLSSGGAAKKEKVVAKKK